MTRDVSGCGRVSKSCLHARVVSSASESRVGWSVVQTSDVGRRLSFSLSRVESVHDAAAADDEEEASERASHKGVKSAKMSYKKVLCRQVSLADTSFFAEF